MLKMVGTVCIDAPNERVWSVLSDVKNISDWSEAVVSARVSSNAQRGIGTERVCELKNGITINERWIDWEEGRSFTYEGFNLPMVKSALNKWSIEESNGKTLLKTESRLEFKGGLLGRMIEPAMRFMAARMGADAMAAFKYLVENGRPFKGKHSALPRAPMSC